MSEKALLEARLLLARSDSKKKRKKPSVSAKENTPVKVPVTEVSPDEKKKRDAILWHKKENYHLTDTLLTLIEESALYKVAFGFDKGAAVSVSSEGKKPNKLYKELATKIFVDNPNLPYKTADLPKLQKAVKNRISNVKKQYADHRSALGQTGQGLVDADREQEIIAGTELRNVWDAIELKFKWYKRVNNLFARNPIASHAAVANSTSVVDTSILERHEHKRVPLGKEADEDGEDGSSDEEGTDDDDDGESSEELEDQECASTATPATPRLAAQVKAEEIIQSVPEASAAPRTGQKRKSMADAIHEAAAADRSARLKMLELKQKEKTARTEVKEKIKRRTLLELESQRMAHQRTEAEKDRAHQLAVLERQIELERVRGGMPSASQSSVPPTTWVLDPALSQ